MSFHSIPLKFAVGVLTDFVIAEVQAVVNPITTKLYSGGGGAGSPSDDDDDLDRDHDEL